MYKIEPLNLTAEEVLKEHQKELELCRQRQDEINLFKEKCKPFEEDIKKYRNNIRHNSELVKFTRKNIVEDRAKLFDIYQQVKST